MSIPIFAMLMAVVPSVQQMKGMFPIMSTTYFEDGAVEYEGLKRETAFVAASGCPGVIWGQSNDAIDLLTREEKRRCFEACASAAEGLDITLALGANGTNTAEMLEIAADIEAVAARHPKTRLAMISRPPDDVRSQEDIEKAWGALATVAKRPVIFQTYGTKETPTPEVMLLVRLAERHPEIYGYIKEEAAGYGAVERMQEENRHRPTLKTLMAGWGGWQLLLQMRHCGCEGLVTERCAYAPLLGKLWSVYKSGNRGVRLAEAFAMFRLLCDQRNFPDGLRGYHLYLLEKEGVFRNRVSRQYKNADVKDAGSFGTGHEWKLETVKLNALQMEELDLLYEDMMDYVAEDKREDCPDAGLSYCHPVAPAVRDVSSVTACHLCPDVM